MRLLNNGTEIKVHCKVKQNVKNISNSSTTFFRLRSLDIFFSLLPKASEFNEINEIC